MDENKKIFLFHFLQNELSLGRTLEVARLALLKAGICQKDEAEEIIEEFKAKITENQTLQGSVLRDKNESNSNWYGGPSDNPSSHWALLKNYLGQERSLSELDLESVDRASTTVVANIAPPFGEQVQISKGLVVGYVQSGKTTNYSAVITKAIDAGYRLIVVLAGIHNNLRLQTEKRLFTEISALKPESATNLTKVDENGDFSRKQALRAERALSRQDGFAIAVLKKNASVLRAFDLWLSVATPKTLQGCPILMIDDEADFASINTNDSDLEPTTINNLIRTVFKRFRTASFIGYTATPFANVFIDASVEDDLYPRDFLLTLEKPVNYFGPEELFGSEALTSQKDKKPLPVVRIIDDEEAAKYSVNRKQKYKPAYFTEMGESLRIAIFSFFISGGIRLCRGHWNKHITMLIHTSNLTDVHNKMFDVVEDFINELKVVSGEGLLLIKEDLEQLYNEDFIPICKSVPVSEFLSFERIWKNIIEFVKRIEVIVENSKSIDRLSFDREDTLWGIVIGGNTLSRGLTIEGLTISYYVRNAKGYDTLLQMGRWFGYRPEYVDLTRIFVTDDLFSRFFHLATVESELREEIKAMAENEERPIDVAVRIRKHPDMVITSNLKMKAAIDSSLTYSGTKIQERYVRTDDPSLLTSNFNAVTSLLNGIARNNISEAKSQFKDFEAYLLYKSVPSELIMQFLDQYRFSPSNVRFNNAMLKSYIFDLSAADELKQWSVAIISSQSGNRLDLGNGRSVYKVQRSVVPSVLSKIDPNAHYLTALSPPQDELIDLDVSKLGPKPIESRAEFRKAVGKSWGAVRMALRPASQGLLLLYPLENNDKSTIEERDATGRQLQPLRASSDLFGITFVFPKTQRSQKSYPYAVNGSV